jgi:hypothetical protein
MRGLFDPSRARVDARFSMPSVIKGRADLRSSLGGHLRE